MAQNPPSNASEPTPDPLVGEEIGLQQTFPASTWDDFAYGRAKQDSNGSYLIRNKSDAVPLNDLIEMRRRDGQTRALLRLFVLPILSCLAEAEWVAPDWTEDDAEAEVEFANMMFRLPPSAGGMSSSLDKIMRYTLLSILEGFSAFEEVRQIPDDGPLKGKITLRKLAHRDSSTIKFRVDDKGGFNGFTQTFRDPQGEIQKVKIDKDKAWYYAVNEEENPYYGVSMFETAWYHYDIKTKLYYIAHVASQFAAVPGRIGYYPSSAMNTPAVNKFTNALATFAFNTSLALPDTYKVDAFNANSGFKFVELIDHHSHMQAKSVLMQFADSENRMVLIDNGKADASADMYVKMLEAIMSQIAESWTNNLMPKYIKWNFGSNNFPVFRFGQLSDTARDAVKEVFTAVVTSSVLNCTPEFVRELEKKLTTRLGLDVNYEEIEKHEKEAARQAAEEQALMAEQQQLMGQDPNNPEAGAQPGMGAQPGPAAAGATPPVAAMSADSDDFFDQLYLAAQTLMNSRPPENGFVGAEDALGIDKDDEETKED